MARLAALRERLRQSLWFVPAVLAVLAGLLALGLLAVDRALDNERESLVFTFGGSAEGARSVLSTIAQSMLTFTGLVFSITMLVLQLASSQLSPRVMRTFLRDRGNQVVLGLFVATFVYTLVVLREVRTPVGGIEEFVPAVSTWVAFALLLASVGAFVWYIDHMAQAIRASTVIQSIWRETVDAVERVYPDRLPPGAGTLPGPAPPEPGPDPGAAPRPDAATGMPLAGAPLLIKASEAGVIVGIDEDALRDAVGSEDRRLALRHGVGDFVAAGAPLAALEGPWDREATDRVRDAVSQANERTMDQDPAFGLRQLVDVAVRSLSPGINDPTTAVQALDRIHDLLRRLGDRSLVPQSAAAPGDPRLVVPRVSWADLVDLAFEEIRRAGPDQVQVVRRLRATLEDLLTAVPEVRRGPLRSQLDALAGTGTGQPAGAPAGLAR